MTSRAIGITTAGGRACSCGGARLLVAPAPFAADKEDEGLKNVLQKVAAVVPGPVAAPANTERVPQIKVGQRRVVQQGPGK